MSKNQEQPKEQEQPPIDPLVLKATKDWLECEKAKIPEAIFDVFSWLILLALAIDKKTQKLKTIQNLLLKAWDKIPSSEKAHISEPVASGKTAGKIKEGPNRKKLRGKKSSKKKTSKNNTSPESPPNVDPKPPVVDPVEQLHPSIGGGQQPEPGTDIKKEATTNPSEVVNVTNETSKNGSKISDFDSDETIKRTLVNASFYDLQIQWSVKSVELERLTNEKTKDFIQAANPYAPAGSCHSFRTIVTMLVMHVGNQLPINRLSKLFSNNGHEIPKSVIFWFMTYSAKIFLPVFIVLCKQLAATCKVIEMDDTNTRINKNDCFAFIEKITSNPETDAQKIAGIVHENIGLTTGDPTKKRKRTAYLSLLSGLLQEDDPLSRVVIKLTHFGQAGDLLGRLLKQFRDHTTHKDLWVVSDLATANQIRDKETPFVVKTSGCFWHARRRFFAVRNLDDSLWHGLRCFAAFAQLEAWNRSSRASPEVIHQRRQRFGKIIIKVLRSVCALLQKTWPKETTPWKAAEYFLKNEYELTQFLRHPFLPISNNRSERLLRPEKLMLAASKFRDTMGGRVTYDVISSIIASCGVAQVDFFTYAMDVLKNSEAVKWKPEEWTPIAWRERQKKPR